jgi:class 3 adenylate cyclase
MPMQPDARYARSGDVNIAYCVVGDGPIDLIFTAGLISHLEVAFEEPGIARFVDRLASFARVIMIDRHGVGLSDPLTGPVSLKEEAKDVLAVLDAVGSERAVLFAYTTGGPLMVQVAASYPERVRGLILYATMARAVAAPDYDWTHTEQEREANIERMLELWGSGSTLENLAPSAAGDERMRAWLGRMERQAASPGGMRMLARNFAEHDVRHLLATMRVPTLIVHRTGDRLIDVRHSRYLAQQIPGARYVELPGEDSLFSVGDSEALIGEIEEFLTGGRHGAAPARALLTILFTDIVDATPRAARMGDARWRDLLTAHDRAVREEIRRFGGREIKTIGDSFLIGFDGPPSNAVRCARAIVDAVRPLGLEVRAGLHTGECEIMGDDVGGMAVHIAARVSGIAAPCEVLVSGTVYGTVVGCGLSFEDRGYRELKGVPGRWPIFALCPVEHAAEPVADDAAPASAA